MAKGRRRGKEDEGVKSLSITSFLQSEGAGVSEARQQVKASGVVNEGGAAENEPNAQLTGIDNEVYLFIKSRGTVSRKELEEWGKMRGLTSAQLFGAIYRLSKMGKITRRIINDQLSYVVR
ncbi:hypothetical protein [Caldivirga sp. MU80]|uniref:hypothetical protein n=1 Tax=Caldivirga sp. MU80 TaxID=1650354 RepID=UPI000832AF5D|nr:hypothetical protein [Caldivirga sp. MU80]